MRTILWNLPSGPSPPQSSSFIITIVWNKMVASTIILAILIATVAANFGKLIQKASATYQDDDGGKSTTLDVQELSQQIEQASDCRQLGAGSSFALCSNTALNNLLDGIIQISEGWGDEII
jgi:hypothetical protein